MDHPYDAKIPIEHLIKVCKWRQGQECCKYIVFFAAAQEFCCVKCSPDRLKVDELAAGIDMTAQGDNCEGLSSATQQATQRLPQ